MNHNLDLYDLFHSLLKEGVKPLYKDLLEQHIITLQEADQEIEKYYLLKRPGLQDAYSKYSEHWNALRELKLTADEHFPYLVQRYLGALGKYYDATELGTDYYLSVLRDNPIRSREWQQARLLFTDRWERLLADRDYAWQYKYIQTLVSEFVRMQERQASALVNQGHMGTDASPRLSWLAAKQDPEMREILRKLLPILRRNPIARELLRLLGRDRGQTNLFYRKTTGNRLMQTLQHAGQSDIVGIKEGGNLSQALHSEIAQLFVPELEDTVLGRFANGHIQTFDSYTYLPDHARATKQHGREVQQSSGEGPAVICVDCSGSMTGTFEQIAKALVLTIGLACERRNRQCKLILFSDQIDYLEFDGMSEGLESLRRFLCSTFHGGTDPSLAITHAIDTLELDNYETADFLLLSDCDMPSLNPVLHQRLQNLKDRGTRMFTVAFGAKHEDYYLDMADHKWIYN